MTNLDVTLSGEDGLRVQMTEDSPVRVLLDEIDAGPAGPQGKYTERIYSNSASAPSAPTGGSLVVGGGVTPPTGWFLVSNLPATPDGERPYVSEVDVNPASQTGTITNPSWGTPTPAGVPGPRGLKGDTGDGARAWIQFSSDNSAWSGVVTSTTKWIRFAVADTLPGDSAAAWSSGIKFVADAPLQLWIQFSSDGSVWHDAQANGRTWIRFATTATKPGNSASDWSAGVDIGGTDGIDGTPGTSITGPQGLRGFYYVEIYQASSTRPTGATGVNVNVNTGEIVTASGDWDGDVPVLTSGQRLWAQKIQVKPGTDQGAAKAIPSSRFSAVYPYTGTATALPVTANPGGDPATSLTTITINGVDYSLGGGTNVVANPMGEATAAVTTIQIGETIYKVSGSEPAINEILITNDRSITARSWINVISQTATEASNTAVVQGDRFLSYGAGLNVDQDFDLKAGTYLVECELWVGSVANQRPMPIVRLTDGTDELARSTIAYVRSPATAYRLFPVVMMVTFATDQTGLEIEVGSGPDETDETSFNANSTTQSGSQFNIGGSISRRSTFRFHRLTAGSTITVVQGGGSDITLSEEGTALPTAMEGLDVIGKRVTASNDPDTPANKRMNFTLTDQDIGAVTNLAKRSHARLEDAGTYIPTYGNFANAGDAEYFQHFGLQLESSDGAFNSFDYSTAYPTGDDTGTQILRISVPHGTNLETVAVTRTTSGGGVTTYTGAGNWGKVSQANGHSGVDYYEWQGSGTTTLRLAIAANDTWRIQTRSLTEKFELDPEKMAQDGATAGQVLGWDGDNDQWSPMTIEIADDTAITDLLHLTRDLHVIAPHQTWEEAVDGDADLFITINSSGDLPPTGITLTDADFAGNGPDVTTGNTPHVFYAVYIRLPIASDISLFRVYMEFSSARGGNAWHRVTGPSPETYQYFFVGQAGNYTNTRVHVQKIPDALAKTQFSGELIGEAASGAASVRELALENKSRLSSIEQIVEVVGSFVNVTLAQNVSGWQFGSSTDTSVVTELDNFEFGDLTFAGVDTNRIFGVSTPLGVSINRVQLNWDGTIYPSSATSTHWVEYRPGAGARADRSYYFVGAVADDSPTIFVTGGGKELDMQIAPVTHTFAITLTAVTVTWWQDDSATGNAPSNAGTETAYISGGLTPIEFPRLTGDRYLHFQVPDEQAIDLIAINGNNEFAGFTEDAGTAGVRKYHSKKIANSGKIDTLIRVIEHTA